MLQPKSAIIDYLPAVYEVMNIVSLGHTIRIMGSFNDLVKEQTIIPNYSSMLPTSASSCTLNLQYSNLKFDRNKPIRKGSFFTVFKHQIVAFTQNKFVQIRTTVQVQVKHPGTIIRNKAS